MPGCGCRRQAPLICPPETVDYRDIHPGAEGYMSWIEELEEKEESIKERLKQKRNMRDAQHIEVNDFRPEIEEYRKALQDHCNGLETRRETALRYALRLRLPVMHHLKGVSLINGPDEA